MAEIQRGKAIVWGVPVLTVGTIIDITTPGQQGHQQSHDFERQSDVVAAMDEVGETVAEVFSNFKKPLRLTVVPFHPTLTKDTSDPYTDPSAVSAMRNMLPKPGTPAQVADPDGVDTPIEVDNSGNYSIKRANLRRASNGIAIVDLELEQMEDDDITSTTT